MAKKKARPRLKDGDKVKVISVPKKLSSMQRFLGKSGRVRASRIGFRMWSVSFRGDCSSLFLRHELKKL